MLSDPESTYSPKKILAKTSQKNELFTTYSRRFVPRQKATENIVGKGENAGNQHFLHFSQCFLSYVRPKS